MKRTKILTVLAALLLILGLAACGMSKDGKENEGSKETGIASLLAADPKTTDEASELHQKLMQHRAHALRPFKPAPLSRPLHKAQHEYSPLSTHMESTKSGTGSSVDS